MARVLAATGAPVKVYKYPLTLAGEPQGVQMPVDARVVHVHEQNDRPVLWALVSPDSPAVTRVFEVIATGGRVPNGNYLGTVHISWTVWHVFELGGAQ
jgi:pyruvate/2-oxoglutarate dehydrogenase complex dihydrolipoamide dehydrogenase (E3) component